MLRITHYLHKYSGISIFHIFYDLPNAREMSGREYVTGILKAPLLLAQLENFRSFTKEHLDQIADNTSNIEHVKPYTFNKFHQLTAFTSFLDISRKANSL